MTAEPRGDGGGGGVDGDTWAPMRTVGGARDEAAPPETGSLVVALAPCAPPPDLLAVAIIVLLTVAVTCAFLALPLTAWNLGALSAALPALVRAAVEAR